MYFVTYELSGKSYTGILSHNENKIIPLSTAEHHYFGTSELEGALLDLIKRGTSFLDKVKDIVSIVEEDNNCPFLLHVNEVKLKAPIPRPDKNIFCLGKNYKEHALEFEKTEDENIAVPKHPVIFTKAVTSVIGTDEAICSHNNVTAEVDYEAELGVVIGKKGINISKEEAIDYIFGFTIINDITARDLQKKHAQWHRGKSLDTFAPMGPYLVHKSAVPNFESLEVTCKVNGEIRQKANTSQLIFDIPTTISILSEGLTLEPGDIIATGTPAGVGMGFTPPKFLKAGDEVEVEITNLGVLKNKVV